MKARPDVKSVRALPSAARHGLRRSPASRFRSACCPRSKCSSATCRSRSTKRRAARRSPTRCCRSCKKTNVIILANHGTVSYGETVERAYWWTEILDAYCRILMLARDLGKVNYFTEAEDARTARPEDEVGLHRPAARRQAWRTATSAPTTSSATAGSTTGVERRAFEAPPAMGRKTQAGPTASYADAVEDQATPRSKHRRNGIGRERRSGSADPDDHRTRAWRRSTASNCNVTSPVCATAFTTRHSVSNTANHESQHHRRRRAWSARARRSPCRPARSCARSPCSTSTPNWPPARRSTCCTAPA